MVAKKGIQDMEKKKKIKIDYQTQYIYGIQVVCKDWVPKDKIITVTSPDEHGLQQVIITELASTKK